MIEAGYDEMDEKRMVFECFVNLKIIEIIKKTKELKNECKIVTKIIKEFDRNPDSFNIADMLLKLKIGNSG